MTSNRFQCDGSPAVRRAWTATFGVIGGDFAENAMKNSEAKVLQGGKKRTPE